MQVGIKRWNDSFFHCSLRKLIRAPSTRPHRACMHKPTASASSLDEKRRAGFPSRLFAIRWQIRSDYSPALLRSWAALSVASQLNSGSERPKCP